MSRSLCASVASSLAGLILASLPALADECPVKLADLIGAEALAALTAQQQANAEDLWRTAALGPTPDEVARTAKETIPNVVRNFWLKPVRSQPFVMADAYAGPDYTSSSPDVFILPGGAGAVCHMIPGVIVFLSDGSTFHYTTVSEVDYGKRTIMLADPWSGVSFLRKGFNQAGVAAEAAPTLGGKPGLRLTFDEFATVFRGEIDMTATIAGVSPALTFDALARIYPELGQKEAFLFWRYTRLLSSRDGSMAMDAIGELLNRPDLETAPSLALLADAAGVMMAIRTNFGIVANLRKKQFTSLAEVPDSADRRAFVAAVRQEVVNALPDLAKGLPTVLLLRMIEDAAETDDLEFQLALAESIAAAHPDDVEWVLAKARALLRLDRTEEARSVLRARQLWLTSVQAAIDVPADQAVAWFDERSQHYHLVSFNLLHWQRARLALLEAIADPTLVTGRTFDWLDAQGKAYAPDGTYGIAYDFLEDVLWLASRRGDAALERELVMTGIARGAGDAQWERHMARSVLHHAQWRRSLKAILGDDWTAARSSFLKPSLCDLLAKSEVLPRSTDPDYLARQPDLVAFCER